MAQGKPQPIQQHEPLRMLAEQGPAQQIVFAEIQRKHKTAIDCQEIQNK